MANKWFATLLRQGLNRAALSLASCGRRVNASNLYESKKGDGFWVRKVESQNANEDFQYFLFSKMFSFLFGFFCCFCLKNCFRFPKLFPKVSFIRAILSRGRRALVSI